MATVEEIKEQARKAQQQLANARKRADEKLGKRLRELVAKKRMDREAQAERATALLDEFADEIKRLADALDSADETGDERSENDGQENNGQEDYGEQYGGSSYA